MIVIFKRCFCFNFQLIPADRINNEASLIHVGWHGTHGWNQSGSNAPAFNESKVISMYFRQHTFFHVLHWLERDWICTYATPYSISNSALKGCNTAGNVPEMQVQMAYITYLHWNFSDISLTSLSDLKIVLLARLHVKKNGIPARSIVRIIVFFSYNDVMMSAVESQIAGVSIVYAAVCSGADQRKHQSFALLAFVWGIHRWPANSLHKGPVMRKMFPIDDVNMSHLRSDIAGLLRSGSLVTT